MTTAAHTLVQCLKAHAVQRAFCVPGESYLSVINSLHDEPAIQLITCRHEGAAGFMALGHARLTGETGVLFVSRGPGCLNAAIAIHSAQQDATPLVVFVGQAERENLQREAFQEVNYEIMFSQMAKWAVEVHDANRLADTICTAFHLAHSGTPGPVVISLPEDMLEDPVRQNECWPRSQTASELTDTQAEAVLTAIQQAKRPLVIAGGLLKSEQGKATLARFAQHFQLPIATSVRHADLFDNRDPLFAGHLVYGLPPELGEAVSQADLVIALGTRLGDVTSQGFKFPAAPQPEQPLIHVWPDEDLVSRYRQTTHPIAAQPIPVMEKLMRLGEARSNPPKAWMNQLQAALQRLRHWEPQPDESDGIVFGNIVHQANQLLPDDAIICLDAGNFGGWVQRYFDFGPRRALIGPSSGAMGYGTPAAVASALAQPDRCVVGFVGDGGFAMTGNDLATAAQYGARLILIISDNRSYGTIRMHQELHYPGRNYSTDLNNPDFVGMARALGAQAHDIQRSSDFQPALQQALKHDGLSVLVVRTALNPISPNATIEALRQRQGVRS